jgi:hypothetical protein
MVFVFTGPTLAATEACMEMPANYLPPAAQGDVYRVAQARPKAIGIIDGYFERLPAVWHKEILWAMREGIHVFGSASMGALRAAELAPFGMEGVGLIFEAYRDGVLEADDEVAVAHGPAESGYKTFSEAMVNIRHTLARAVTTGVIASVTREALERIAKDLYYPQRIYPLILQIGTEQGVAPGELDALRAWLPEGRVNQKRLDALEMLRVMRESLRCTNSKKQVAYAFEHTDFWERAKYSAGQMKTSPTSKIEMATLDSVQDELGLDPEAHARARQGVLLRLFALETARRAGLILEHQMLQQMVETFRRERELLEPDGVERWLTAQQLDRESFGDLIQDEARVRWAIAWAEPDISPLARLPACYWGVRSSPSSLDRKASNSEIARLDGRSPIGRPSNNCGHGAVVFLAVFGSPCAN